MNLSYGTNVIEDSGLVSTSKKLIDSWKVRALVVAVVFFSTTPYFLIAFSVFKFEDITDVFFSFSPWLALIYMAIYWVLDRKISLYLVVVFTLICAPLAVLAALSGVGLLLLFPSIWLAVYLVRFHLKST